MAEKIRVANDLNWTINTISELKRAVRWSIRGHFNLLITGPFGIGKTAAAEAIGREISRSTYTLSLSQADLPDFCGYILPTKTLVEFGGTMVPMVHHGPSHWALELEKNGGLLILDEFTSGSPSLRAAALRLLSNNEIPPIRFDRRRMGVIACCNPPDEAEFGHELSQVSGSRFAHVRFDVTTATVKEWCEGFANYWGKAPKLGFEGIDDETSATRLDEAWIKARSMICGFLHRVPAAWHECMLDKDVKKSRELANDSCRAYACGRTWAWASTILAQVLEEGRHADEALYGMMSLIGPAAREFCGWVRDSDLPDPEAVLADPAIFVPDGRGDRSMAVLSGVTAAIDSNFTPERWVNGIIACNAVQKDGNAEVASDAFPKLYQKYIDAQGGAYSKGKEAQRLRAAALKALPYAKPFVKMMGDIGVVFGVEK